MLSFIAIVLLLFLIPGPAVIITITQTLKGGKKNGIFTALGIGLGDLVHTLAAVLGLSAILMNSATAFEIVKYIGVAYLVYLGIQMLLTKPQKIEKPTVEQSSASSSFRQGFLAEILNPKTALFFLAFLPQFVQHNGQSITVQLLILGITFVVMSALYTILLAIITSFIGEKIFTKTSNNSSRWIEKAVGFVYIGLGVKLALQTQSR
ncbi:LysE family translocator [Lysinibacillus xylanilyticus]|uniref:LysE family translocator n=1 Tax=Lysinibacillus xylanilyticus TaxID=582475 RepID=A0ABT4EUX4_9BACI|nr:LysE family translocator [Lysinibacillus xylanilyticus]MCY9549472.1 LysE family translocator [Lysinibacillus xylanilyticus]MED3803963.1 LysE family translocator [Lysinibacillus xylanilyticus]